MNYTTPEGARLTDWAVRTIKRDYPGDVALLIAVPDFAVDGDGHGECFDYFVPATERGLGLARDFIIAGVGHDLYPRDWARCERTAALEDWGTACLREGEILYSRSPEDTARFKALQETLERHLADRDFMYRKALERLDEAMTLYRTMMFEERLYQVRMAAGYAAARLLDAVRCLNGTAGFPAPARYLAELAQCTAQPEHFAAYYRTLTDAQTAQELRQLTHLLIQTTRQFMTAHRPAQELAPPCEDYTALADWYAEMSRIWRSLRYYCGAGEANAALVEACLLQSECNDIAERYGLGEMDILGGFDARDLPAFAARATEIEQTLVSIIEERGGRIDRYVDIGEFLEKNP